LSIPETWVVEESSGEITLRPSIPGGAITVSTYRHEDPDYRADAVEQCARFVASRTDRNIEVHGSRFVAGADFRDADGVWWLVRIITVRNQFALATYNTGIQSDGETREARAILSGIAFVDGTVAPK
jgi:hypothetical protein